MIPQSPDGGMTESKGVWVLDYAWNLYVAHAITFEKLLLLSMVDAKVNTYAYRHFQDHEPFAPEPGDGLRIGNGELTAKLRCCTKTLKRMIKELGVRLLPYVGKIGRSGLHLKTRERPEAKVVLLLPNSLLDAFRAGLSGPAVALLSKIHSMESCTASDATLGEWMGLSASRIGALLAEAETPPGYSIRLTAKHPDAAGDWLSSRRIIVIPEGGCHADDNETETMPPGETAGRTGHGFPQTAVSQSETHPIEHQSGPGVRGPERYGTDDGIGCPPTRPRCVGIGGNGGVEPPGHDGIGERITQTRKSVPLTGLDYWEDAVARWNDHRRANDD